LGWEPKAKFHELVRLMVDADVRMLKEELNGQRRSQFVAGKRE
jgi:hypothetical protein